MNTNYLRSMLAEFHQLYMVFFLFIFYYVISVKDHLKWSIIFKEITLFIFWTSKKWFILYFLIPCIQTWYLILYIQVFSFGGSGVQCIKLYNQVTVIISYNMPIGSTITFMIHFGPFTPPTTTTRKNIVFSLKIIDHLKQSLSK